MSRPDTARLFAAMEATWPPASMRKLGPVTLRFGDGGGSRVSAATVAAGYDAADLDAAEAAMRAAGQAPLWQVRGADEGLDADLEARGYAVMDPVWLYLGPARAEAPPRISAFAVWPPLAIQRDLWAEGGIGPARQAVMERVARPKAALLARSDDRPSGVGFVACDGDIAMVHAVFVPERARRRGAARNLMMQAACWAAGTGADWLGLAVTKANVAANGLYASLGMEIVEQYHYRVLSED